MIVGQRHERCHERAPAHDPGWRLASSPERAGPAHGRAALGGVALGMAARSGALDQVPYQPHKPAAKARSNDPSTGARTRPRLPWSRRARPTASASCCTTATSPRSTSATAAIHRRATSPLGWTLIDAAASYTAVTVSGAGVRIIGHAQGGYVQRNQPYPGTDGRVETYRRATLHRRHRARAERGALVRPRRSRPHHRRDRRQARRREAR